MGLIFADSFEIYGTSGEAQGNWDEVSSDWGFVEVLVPHLGRAISDTGAGTPVLRRGITPTTEFVMHFWLALGGGGSLGFEELITLRDSSGTVVGALQGDRPGDIRYVGGSVSASAMGVISEASDVLSLVEIKLKLATDSSGMIEVRVNGDTVIDESGVATANNGNDVEEWRFRKPGINRTRRLSRLVVMDWSGSLMNDFTGEIEPIRVPITGDGAVTDYSPDSGSVNADRVNETVSDGDSSYVETSTVGDIDEYAASAEIETEGPDILFLRQVSIQRTTEPGSSFMRHLLRPDPFGALHQGSKIELDEQVYRSTETYWLTDPEREAVWSGSDLDAGIRAGQEHTDGS